MNRTSVAELRRCSLLISGFSADISDQQRDFQVKPALDRGAVIRWLSPYQAIAVFASDAKASSCLSAFPGAIRVQLVSDMDDPTCYDEVISEIFGAFKPENDTRVANRMIGAALGKRIAPAPAPSATKAATSVADAWD